MNLQPPMWVDPVPKEAGQVSWVVILLRALAWITRAPTNCSLQVYLARDQEALHLSVQHELLATVPFQTIAGETNLSSPSGPVSSRAVSLQNKLKVTVFL